MHISSRDNPKIKLYLRLLSSKKARQAEGMFVIEGARLCADAVTEYKKGRLDIYAAFAAPSALEKYGDYIDPQLFSDCFEGKFHTLDEALAGKICDTKETQGIFIIAKMPDNIFKESSIKSDGRYLVLDNVQDPGNVGTILRTADAVGADGVILSNNCCDLYNPKTVRATMGSLFRLNILVCNDFEKLCTAFDRIGVKTMAAVVDSDAVSVESADYSGGCAVVIGNEGSGIPKEHVSLCREKITIRMSGNANSLNAAMAAGIILWEMTDKGKASMS